MAVIILDRDGVINYDSAEYIKSAEEWRAIPNSINSISRLSKAGYKIYIATNQAGLARKLFTKADLDAMHDKLRILVQEAGGKINEIFYCPHHPDDACKCRKPGIGLLEKIAEHANEDLRGQAFVGDSLKDIQAAEAMGCEPFLVLTGNGQNTRAALDHEVKTFDNLGEFADFIL